MNSYYIQQVVFCQSTKERHKDLEGVGKGFLLIIQQTLVEVAKYMQYKSVLNSFYVFLFPHVLIVNIYRQKNVHHECVFYLVLYIYKLYTYFTRVFDLFVFHPIVAPVCYDTILLCIPFSLEYLLNQVFFTKSEICCSTIPTFFFKRVNKEIWKLPIVLF